MFEFYDRKLYFLFNFDIPNLRGIELKREIMAKLANVYPGNIDDHIIQIRKNYVKKGEYLVFVLDKNTGNKMLPLSPLFIQSVFAGKTAKILYIDNSWIEYISLENGTLKFSTVKPRDSLKLNEDIKELCGTESVLTLCCNSDDKVLLSSHFTDRNIQFIDSAVEKRKISPYKISLFTKKSPIIKLRKAIAYISIMIILAVLSLLLYGQRKDEFERINQQKIEQEKLQEVKRLEQLELKRLDELKKQYQEIISSKIATPFDIASVIADCSQSETRIQTATFGGGYFQIEGFTHDSLVLLSMFENNRYVSNARLHQVHPVDNREAFTISGTVNIGTTIPDNSLLSLSEQIDKMEKILAEELSYASSEMQLSPSEVGDAIKKLFLNSGCTVNSYQFMNEQNITEVEYILRGPGYSFFSALYEINTKHRMWEVRSVQIRNLYPFNTLDIIVRIRTEYYQPKNYKISDTYNEELNIYPISKISRNYYIEPQQHFIAELDIEQDPVPEILEPEPQQEESINVENVPWLEYVGTINEDSNNKYIYLKNTRTGEIIKLDQANEGNFRYIMSQTNELIAYIDDHIYEIKRR